MNLESQAAAEDRYFGSYSKVGIHQAMIKDRSRTLAYKAAITENRHLFKNKVVLDVGCGTGILSMFAARAGASIVYAVDCSSIIERARTVIQDNNLGEKICLIKGLIEDIELPIDQVDVIISEWMGYCLLFESMLDSVLYARDKWLRPGGLMFPDYCTLNVFALTGSEQQNEANNCWSNLFGFNFSALRDLSIQEARITYVDPALIATDEFRLKSFDLYKIKKDDVNFSAPFKLTKRGVGCIQAIVTYFTVDFLCCHVPVSMSTSPMLRKTHWRQTVFNLSEKVYVDHGEIVFGTLTLEQNKKSRRELDVSLDICYSGKYEPIHWVDLLYYVK